jgi:serine/threonine protein kinase
MPPTPPTTIGPYRILRKLGQGGMGVVYEVQDPQTGQTLALKLILESAASPTVRERFSREAGVLAKIQHPGVVRIHGMARAPEGPYIVQELLDGESLDDVVRRGGLPPPEAARVVRDLADAAAAVHAHGILHRDIKPGNVILRAGNTPVLLDFGLVRDQNAETLTNTGAVMGTPTYMAPEQANGTPSRDLTAATDVHALGGLLYAMLVGRGPFLGPSYAVIIKLITEDPPWPSAEGVDVPPALEAILRVAMAKDLAVRYASAEALRDDLDRFLAGETPLALACLPKSKRGLHRKPFLLIPIVAVILGGVGFALNARNTPTAEIAPKAPAQAPPTTPTPDVAKGPVTLPRRLPLKGTPPIVVREKWPLGDAASVRWLTNDRILVSPGTGPGTISCYTTEGGAALWTETASSTLAVGGGSLYAPVTSGFVQIALVGDRARKTFDLSEHGQVRALAVHPSDPTLVAVDTWMKRRIQGILSPPEAVGGWLLLYDLESETVLSKEKVSILKAEPVGLVAFSPDGALVAAATVVGIRDLGHNRHVVTSAAVRERRLKDFRVRGTHAIGSFSLAFVSNTIFVVGSHQTIQVFGGAHDGKYLDGRAEASSEGISHFAGGATVFAHNFGAVYDLDSTREGRCLSLSSGAAYAEGELRIWSTHTWEESQEPLHLAPCPASVALDPSGTRLLVGYYGGRVEIRSLLRP